VFLCSLVTLSLKRTVFEIFDFKNAVTLKTGLGVRQGPSVLEMSPSGKCHRSIKVKVKVRTLDIAPLRGTPHQKRSGTDHTVSPANFTVPASTYISIERVRLPIDVLQ